MGLFKKDPLKEIFKDYKYGGNDDILETAKIISGSDPEVMKCVEFALNEPVKYIKQYAERFSERGIELDDPHSFKDLDSDELLFLAMLDVLEERNFAFEFDYKCELEDFLWGLEQIKNYPLIKDAVHALKLDENDDIEGWGEEINAAIDKICNGALDEKPAVCYIDIDSDSYPLTILTYGELGALPIPWIMAM